jgi:hypothetical protein
MWCIHLHDYELEIGFYSELSIHNAIGYARILHKCSLGCRAETEAHSMSTSFGRATVNESVALFYDTCPLSLPLDLREATDVYFMLLQFPD